MAGANATATPPPNARATARGPLVAEDSPERVVAVAAAGAACQILIAQKPALAAAIADKANVTILMDHRR